MAVNEEVQLRRIAELGIADFETAEDVERLQADMLARLERSSVDPDRYAGLDDCRSNFCGRVNCLEACWFGARRRRLNEIAAVYDLLQRSRGPMYEVRFVRGFWARPFGQLRQTNVAAAKKLNGRALDKLFNPKLVAVGTFKVSATPERGQLWICEIHQIIAGAERPDLENVLSSKRQGMRISNRLWLQEVENLAQVISNVFQRDLECWQDPEDEEVASPDPSKARRREFYKWLLSLSPGERIVRYGCDQHFNELRKQPRTFRATVRKPRPYPYHLKRYMFGCRERAEIDDDIYDPHEGGPDDVLKSQTARRRKELFPFAKIVDRKRYFDFRARSRRRRT